jgi:exonuclease SbcC
VAGRGGGSVDVGASVGTGTGVQTGESAGDREPGFGLAASAISAVVAYWHRAAERVATGEAALAAADAELGRVVASAALSAAEVETRLVDTAARRDRLAHQRDATEAALTVATAAADLDLDTVRRLLAAAPERAAELAAKLEALGRADALAAAVVAERARDVDAHATVRPVAVDDASRLDELARAAQDADDRAAQLAAELAADAGARDRRATALAELARAEAACEIDRVLGNVIGSHDGKLFRSFAQSLTLDALLAVANAHLDELAPRYRLERVPRHDLELQVVDRELGDELRSVQTLSGGESFLVSLALALGLSAMSAHDVRVRTLLIDEGFGTLDPATLDTALAVLDRLQATGRQIGVISHVPALVERVGAHVRVVQRGNGRSEVIVAG